MKKLIIAEKPSVAKDIAEVIGNLKKTDDGYENEDFVVSSAVGHIVELFMPEDIDPALKKWTLDNLPIIPEKFHTKPITKNKSKFLELKKLMNRKDIELVINACDAGREGELIFAYIYELAGCKKKSERLWLSSMTPDSIRGALQHLRSSEEMKNLLAAAKCRSEADWLIGINGTRAITSKIFNYRAGGVATIGRVQTPTLSMLLRREKEIRHFKPKTFYRILAEFEIANGRYWGTFSRSISPKNEDERPDRIFDREEADRIVEEAKKNSEAIVSEKKKKSKQNAPKLYDLTTLQREANSKYGMPAGMTLKIAQSLYERHKCVTYPRTDSNALPEDYPLACVQTLHSLKPEFMPFAQEILEKNWIDSKNKKIFDNKKISDHFAIIPTIKAPSDLSDEETKIYNMIVKRFLAVFYPAAEFDITTRCSKIAEYEFWTEGKVLTFPGWLTVYGKTLDGGETLPALSENNEESAKVIEVHSEEDQTRPQPRYTEATLLSMMETAGRMLEDDELADAMKERGLGTPATRAQIIDHLIELNYMERKKRELIPSAKAEGLFDYLDAVGIQVLSNPVMTGDWEYKLLQMEHGELSREEFMQGIRDLTTEIVYKIKNFDENNQVAKESVLISPTDQLPMLEYLRFYKSQDEKLTLNKVIGGRRMQETEFAELLKTREIGPLEGFRSKLGKIFSAKLVLNDANEIKFVFDAANRDSGVNDDLTLEKLKKFPVIGKCRCEGCDGNVYATDGFYICENYLTDKKCTIRLGKRILEQAIDETQAKKLLEEGKSDLLENFCSKKTGKVFAAYLLLDDKGKITFEFPPRASSN